jgi:hypothetical protein
LEENVYNWANDAQNLLSPYSSTSFGVKLLFNYGFSYVLCSLLFVITTQLIKPSPFTALWFGTGIFLDVNLPL